MTLAQWMADHPHLSCEWDESANIDLSPDTVSHGSKKRAFWVCEAGHKWQAAIYARTGGGKNCPYCSNRRVLEGFNDLATKNADALKLWDHEKNDLSPTEVTVASHKRVWWKCENGHAWQASVASVASLGSGCPYCSGKRVIKGENDLESCSPALAGEWCGEKNPCSSDEISRGSKKKAFWTCELGHTWQATVYSRTGKQSASCPYCSNRRVLEGFNDLKTTHPQLADEWCEELNGDLTPAHVTGGSHKRVWWKCESGHVWQAYVFARTKENGTTCPICSGRFKKNQ